jgi:hypothetical protein
MIKYSYSYNEDCRFILSREEGEGYLYALSYIGTLEAYRNFAAAVRAAGIFNSFVTTSQRMGIDQNESHDDPRLWDVVFINEELLVAMLPGEERNISDLHNPIALLVLTGEEGLLKVTDITPKPTEILLEDVEEGEEVLC